MSEKSTVIYGLDEEFQNIDISEAKGSDAGGGAGLHLMPTQDAASQLPPLAPTAVEFIDSTSGSGEEVTGEVSTGDPQSHPSAEWGSLKHRRPPGKTASYLESKGFGWLLEVQEDEEDLKPLL